MYSFIAPIYTVGINYCVDVPFSITSKMNSRRGYIPIKGEINGYAFEKSLVAVKDAPYRLFVNKQMLKGARAVVGEKASFFINPNVDYVMKEFQAPELLISRLKEVGLLEVFNSVTPSCKRNIYKYMSFIKKNKRCKRILIN